MAKYSLPEERRVPSHLSLLICFGLTLIPAVVVAVCSRPFTQEHLGLFLAAAVAGGFIYWASSNLLTGTFKSKQGVYRRRDAPWRYWLHTGVVAALAVASISILIHQALIVLGTQ